MDNTEINAAIGDRISDVLGTEGEMVTKWVALIEVVDADGHRWIRTQTNEGAKAWDNLGLLTFGLQYEQAAAVHDHQP